MNNDPALDNSLMAALIGVLALLTLALAVFLPYGSAKRRSESAGSAECCCFCGGRKPHLGPDSAQRNQKVPFITPSRRAETREEGAHRIDVKDDEHRPLAHIVRSTQKLLGDYKIEHAARHEHEVLAGHFGIGMVARDEGDRDQARQILKAHNGHFINFYGRWTTEYMDP